MFRIDDPTAATSLPAPEAAGTEGYFTEGNPTAGTPATNVRGSWLNMIQEELRAIVVAAGLAPSKTTYTQVRDAIKTMVGFRNIFAAANSTTFTVPSWCNVIKCRVWGGGGGAGGTNGASAAASGGNGGGYTEGVFSVTPGQVLTVTVGAGGTSGPVGSNGGTGGTSSVGALCSATGGGGGVGINSGSAAGNTTTFGNGAGGVINVTGQGASSGFLFGTSYAGSQGGGTFGAPPSPMALGRAGYNGLFPGGAGSGAAGGNFAGGAGAGGLVIIEY